MTRDELRRILFGTEVVALRRHTISGGHGWTPIHLVGVLIGILKALPDTERWKRSRWGPFLWDDCEYVGVCERCEDPALYEAPDGRGVRMCRSCGRVFIQASVEHLGLYGQLEKVTSEWQCVGDADFDRMELHEANTREAENN